ncbi:MAG: extracellular solute-binding protein, partial [Anaerolineae bacterium]
MSSKKMTRRDFLKYAGLASGAAMAASVMGSLPAAAAGTTERPTLFQFPHIQKKEFEGVTVRMHAISGANYDELYKIIPEWEEQTGAQVEFVFQGDGFQTDKRLVQDFAAGTVDYDVCWDHSSFFSQYVKADGLEPLENWFSEEELADFIPRLVDATRRDGHLWVIPRHFDISCLHYRTDLMSAEQVPETWDQFKELAKQLTDPAKGIYGTQFAGKEEALSGRFYEVLLAEGGQLFDEKWEPVFNSPAGVKAASMFAELYAAGAMPPGMTNFVWEDVAKNFAAGIIAIYSEWYGWYGFFQDPTASKVAGKFELARQPRGDGKIQSGLGGHNGLSSSKAS